MYNANTYLPPPQLINLKTGVTTKPTSTQLTVTSASLFSLSLVASMPHGSASAHGTSRPLIGRAAKPFSLLVGREGRGRGHGGAEAFPGYWASDTTRRTNLNTEKKDIVKNKHKHKETSKKWRPCRDWVR